MRRVVQGRDEQISSCTGSEVPVTSYPGSRCTMFKLYCVVVKMEVEGEAVILRYTTSWGTSDELSWLKVYSFEFIRLLGPSNKLTGSRSTLLYQKYSQA